MRWVKLTLNLFLGTVGVCALLILAGHFGYLDTFKPYIVQSGSMEPAIPLGSVVFTRHAPGYSQYDIVTFKQSGNSKNIVTHRVMFKKYPDGIASEPSYITMGDANEEPDREELAHKDIIGKVYFSMPYLGYAVDRAKTPQGFILFVIIPATIIVYEELRSIQRELTKLFGRRRNNSQNNSHPEQREGSLSSSENLAFARNSSAEFTLSKLNVPQNDIWGGQVRLATVEEAVVVNRGMPKAALVVPLIGCLLVFISLSAAYFFDNEQSTENVLSAASSFTTPTSTVTPTPTGPPIAQTLVINEFLWDSSCGQNANAEAANYWIELFNGSAVVVNLKDWQFSDGNSNVIQISNANKFLDPGEYIVITKDGSVFTGCYTLQGTPETANLGGSADFLPATTGGVVRLEQPDGVGGFIVVDRVEYGPSQNGGVLNTPEDQSIARSPNGVDSALGDTFAVGDFVIDSTISPGVAN